MEGGILREASPRWRVVQDSVMSDGVQEFLERPYGLELSHILCYFMTFVNVISNAKESTESVVAAAEAVKPMTTIATSFPWANQQFVPHRSRSSYR